VKVKGACRLAASVFFLVSLLSGSVQAQTFEMRTVVKDFVTTEWTLECPDGQVLDMTTVDLTEEGIHKLIECLNQIEAQNGTHIQSSTVVRDSVTVSDEIVSTTNLTEAQVNKIKGIIDAHQMPMNPFPGSRPRIESVRLDGALDSFIIDLGEGCLIDLTDVPIDPQTLNELIQLIQQFEAQNGVHVTGATTVKDGAAEKDRVIQFTYLTPQQIERLLQFFQAHGIALLFPQKLAPMHMQGVIDFNGQRIPFDASGDALLQPQPPDPQTGAIPVEIVALSLQSVDPVPVSVGLGPGPEPLVLMLHPVDHTGKLNLVETETVKLAFENVGPNQDTLFPNPEFAHEFGAFGCGPWPFSEPVRLHSLGRKHLMLRPDQLGPGPGQGPGGGLGQGPGAGPGQGSGGNVQAPGDGAVVITQLELGLPLRLPVIPGGFGN